MVREMPSFCGNFWTSLHKITPFLAMICVQCGYSGLFIISMVSFKHGMTQYILVVYRHVVATFAIAPFALILERKIRPKMTIAVFMKITALGFLEPVLGQNLNFLGMQYTSATFASALVNVIPAITFVMALIFRMEQIKIKKRSSQAKVVGTIFTMTGAMVMTLYKGPIVDFFWSRGHAHRASASTLTHRHFFIGTLMTLGGDLAWSGFFVLQAHTVNRYPAPLSLACLICLTGMIQTAAVALVMEHNRTAWVIGWDSRLLAPIYSALVCSGIAYYVQNVVSKAKGPVFVTAFTPLCMVFTAALGSIILSEQVHLGSCIGAVIVVVGLYSIMWGKSKENSVTYDKADMQDLPVVNTNGVKSSIIDNEINNGFVEVQKIPPTLPPSQN